MGFYEASHEGEEAQRPADNVTEVRNSADKVCVGGRMS